MVFWVELMCLTHPSNPPFIHHSLIVVENANH